MIALAAIALTLATPAGAQPPPLRPAVQGDPGRSYLKRMIFRQCIPVPHRGSMTTFVCPIPPPPLPRKR